MAETAIVQALHFKSRFYQDQVKLVRLVRTFWKLDSCELDEYSPQLCALMFHFGTSERRTVPLQWGDVRPTVMTVGHDRVRLS